jgi:hypothetical protein
MIVADKPGKATLTTSDECVDRFVTRHGLQVLLRHAKETILRQFKNVESLKTSVQYDPEDEGVEWLQLDVNVRSTPEAVVAARTAFRKELARLTPGVNQSLLRLCVGVRAE